MYDEHIDIHKNTHLTFMGRKFNYWYTDEVSIQLEKGIPVMEININLHLSLIKPLHVE